ncbi:MAG TPA: hypothetical protein VJ859_14225 [Allosphingosinicella sp.]|nr:hypothetical protein [Allosphingosinicella sp.]
MLIAIVKKRLALDASLSTILQLISVTAFEKIPIDQLLSKSTPPNQSHDPGNQLILFSD